MPCTISYPWPGSGVRTASAMCRRALAAMPQGRAQEVRPGRCPSSLPVQQALTRDGAVAAAAAKRSGRRCCGALRCHRRLIIGIVYFREEKRPEPGSRPRQAHLQCRCRASAGSGGRGRRQPHTQDPAPRGLAMVPCREEGPYQKTFGIVRRLACVSAGQLKQHSSVNLPCSKISIFQYSHASIRAREVRKP